MKKEHEKKEQKPYAWVNDATGNEFLCPADVLKKAGETGNEELEDCINVEALKPHAEDL
jgi:hypothetical protein